MLSILLIALPQLEDYACAKLLSEHCYGGIRLIRNEIKQRLGKNTKASYQMKKIKKMLPLAQCPAGRKLEGIMELKGQLKN